MTNVNHNAARQTGSTEADPAEANTPAILTVGHGALDAESFTRLVTTAGVETVADVRRFPGSRRHPHFGGTEMARWLREAGVEYRWLQSLGGRRALATKSPNTGLRNEQFRAYADHMATDEFAAGVADLLAVAEARRAAVMCAESVWWRCHRRLLADHLVLVASVDVEHLFHDGRVERHTPSAEARRDGSKLVYDVGTQGSLLGTDHRRHVGHPDDHPGDRRRDPE
jgi:uncharacterized protein (DUF488 family)